MIRHLYLVRHAEAEPERTTDAERRLTEKGKRQAEKLGRFCLQQGLAVDAIFSSPLVRAVQTAEPVAQALKTKVHCSPELASGMTPGRLRAFLEAQKDSGSLMIVGHEPDLSEGAADLLGHPAVRLELKKGSLLRLSFAEMKLELATLDFLVPVRFL